MLVAIDDDSFCWLYASNAAIDAVAVTPCVMLLPLRRQICHAMPIAAPFRALMLMLLFRYSLSLPALRSGAALLHIYAADATLLLRR